MGGDQTGAIQDPVYMLYLNLDVAGETTVLVWQRFDAVLSKARKKAEYNYG
jgi:hypothetical protein